MNVCRRCGQVFGSAELFDRHRVGRHAFTFAEGMEMRPAVEDGRRCLDACEMGDAGWRLNGCGRWFDPARDPRGRLRETPERREAVGT